MADLAIQRDPVKVVVVLMAIAMMAVAGCLLVSTRSVTGPGSLLICNW